MNLTTAIQKRIKELLMQRLMSIYRLELLSGISHSTMSCLLGDKNKNCNFKTLFKIIYALDITPKEFFSSKLFDEEKIMLD